MLSLVAELKVLGSFLASSSSWDLVTCFPSGLNPAKSSAIMFPTAAESLVTRALTQASSICLRLAWTALESAAFSSACEQGAAAKPRSVITRSGVNNFIIIFQVEFRVARLEPQNPFRAGYIEVSALTRVDARSMLPRGLTVKI